MKTRRYRPWRRRILSEFLEPRHLLSAVGFVPHDIVAPPDADGPSSVQAADLDGDGDVDFLSASSDDDKIAWYENTDGVGSFGPQQVITTDADGASAVAIGDLDGDGDLDVLSASSDDDKIAWYENTNGAGGFGPQQVISTELHGATTVTVGDLDGDGDLDVLSASVDKIAWYENTDGAGSFGLEQVITADANDVTSVTAGDLDGDGDLDVISSFWRDGLGRTDLAWYENTDGAGSFAPQRVISTESDEASSMMVGDLDGDGDLDVIATFWGSGREGTDLAWYENADGDGSRWIYRSISRGRGARSLAISDVDADGDLDVVSNKGDGVIVWYENLDGAGSFARQQVFTACATSLTVADVDGDNDLDILTACSANNTIAWYENTVGGGGFRPQEVMPGGAAGVESVAVGDLDGDGDLDVLSASYRDDKIAWYENIDGAGTFGPQQVISLEAEGARFVTLGDLDGDGDLDVLSAESVLASSSSDIPTGEIAWYENTDGDGTFGPQQVITSDAVGASSLTIGDLDGDGDLDVISAASQWRQRNDTYEGKIAWYENADGAGNFGPQQVISDGAWDAISVTVGDLDGDGDLDVVSAFRDSGNDGADLAWYENIVGKGSFGQQQVITDEALGASSVTVGDLNGDGDLDVLLATSEWDSQTGEHEESTITWFDNTDGSGSFGPQQVIGAEGDGARCVTVGDLDGDGDLDVVSASSRDDNIAWYENVNGTGSFGPQQVAAADAAEAVSVTVGDLDGDGDLDVVSAASGDDMIAWHENTDGQGTFGEQQVMTVEVAGASSVAVGDLDGDGDLDIVSSSDEMIAWHENTDGAGTFGPQQVISTEAVGARFVTSCDLDGDGDLDVLLASSQWDPQTGKLAWYENIDGAGSFGPEQVITTNVDGARWGAPRWATTGDLDGDGDLDVLSASESEVSWYENADGSGDFGTPQVIATEGNLTVSAGDLDGDGDLDVLSASGDKIGWYENTNGKGRFGTQQVIVSARYLGFGTELADLDGDGDLDILGSYSWYENIDGTGGFRAGQAYTPPAAEFTFFHTAGDMDGDGDLDVLRAMTGLGNDVITWDENMDGLGKSFGRWQIDADHASSLAVGDLDGDGDLDVVSASSVVTWYENENRVRLGHFGQPHVLTTAGVFGASSVVVGDVDGDGDLDALSAAWADDYRNDIKIAWNENTDGVGKFGPQQAITTETEVGWRGSVITAGDMDGDGDLDVLSAAWGWYDRDTDLAWYENTDAVGTFGPRQVITNELDGAESVTLGDLDGDGDLDVLFASSRDGKIGWYENTDGAGSFGPQQLITAEADESVTLGDLDGDGDLDVLGADGDGKIAWFENTDGAGNFGPQQLITAEADGAGMLGDLDGDGDLDVAAGTAWYENTDGAGRFGPQQTIITDAENTSLAAVGDVDGDGDLDVLAAMAWYENMDGAGRFGPQQTIITDADDASLAALADMDADGDLDFLSASGGRIDWYENRLAGDANDDGEVQFADFGALADNFGRTDAVWEEGDFDGDGVVQFSDFVILANNFGNSRQPVVAPTSSASLQAAETLPTARISAADEFFERFDDQLSRKIDRSL